MHTHHRTRALAMFALAAITTLGLVANGAATAARQQALEERLMKPYAAGCAQDGIVASSTRRPAPEDPPQPHLINDGSGRGLVMAQPGLGAQKTFSLTFCPVREAQAASLATRVATAHVLAAPIKGEREAASTLLGQARASLDWMQDLFDELDKGVAAGRNPAHGNPAAQYGASQAATAQPGRRRRARARRKAESC